MVEAGDDLQQGALAAAGWSDEHANLASAERKVEIGKNVVPLAGGAGERLARDLDFKLHGAATLIVGPLTAAPGRSRWRGRPPRMSSNRRAGGGCRTAERRRRSRNRRRWGVRAIRQPARSSRPETCLLYTSDAADEEDSVDLGGRR